MSVATPLPARRPRRRSALRRAGVFGIEVVFPADVPLLPSTVRRARHGARPTTVVEPTTAAELARRWPRRDATTVLERRFPDGRLVMSVDHVPGTGFLVYAPWNGRHLVAEDGSRIASALPPSAPWRWQRLLVAQVLPLAATLRGIELLHASAVDVGGTVVGLVAPAGTGKTSVAAHAVARGAALVTDDVLALELSDGVVVAHPGVGTVNIAAEELRRLPAEGRGRLGRELGRSEKVVVAAPTVDAPRRLDALCFLRRPVGRKLVVEPLEPDPFLLLANSFNLYVRSPARIRNQLAVLDGLAGSVAMWSVSIPRGAPAGEVARAVREQVAAA